MKRITTFFFLKMNQFENFVINHLLETFKHIEIENYESLRNSLNDICSIIYFFSCGWSSTHCGFYICKMGKHTVFPYKMKHILVIIHSNNAVFVNFNLQTVIIMFLRSLYWKMMYYVPHLLYCRKPIFCK